MMFDRFLIRPSRSMPRDAGHTAAGADDFRDTEPSMFWLDSEPPVEPAVEVPARSAMRPATMPAC